MWNVLEVNAAPDYWPPRPSRFWCAVLEPWRKLYLRRRYHVDQVTTDGLEECFARFGPADGVLLAPNHSYDGDPHVMLEVGCRAGRRFHFMAAWQLFHGHWGLDGLILQRLGAFSVDREGVDRRAVRQAIDLLTHGAGLVVFPEGEVYRLNERLTPLLEGVAFMALSAQRELAETSPDAHVWIVPTALRYSYLEDVRPQLEAAMDRLEARLLWKPRPGATLAERILRFGEVLLTIKEKEKLGRSCEADGDLPTRIRQLIAVLLEQLETKRLGRSPAAETVPLRVKALRRSLLETWTNEEATPEARSRARAALDEVHLVLQLYSYPGDYLAEDPSPERMAETIDKFEEDMEGVVRPKGRRKAEVAFGEPIDMKPQLGAGRPRTVVAGVTDGLEQSLQSLMSRSPRCGRAAELAKG
jgi:1-acyl-sn-glycerol-3-phosphate acyltransferase